MWLHDNLRFGNGVGYGFVWQDLSTIDIELVLHHHVLAQHGAALHAHPATHGAAPAHDAARQPRVRVDYGTAHYGTALDAGTCDKNKIFIKNILIQQKQPNSSISFNITT